MNATQLLAGADTGAARDFHGCAGAIALKLLVNLAWRLRFARQARARANESAPGMPPAVVATIEGAYLEAWNSLQTAKAIYGEDCTDVDLDANVIDMNARYRLNGTVWTGTQLQEALECVQTLAWAYERADEQNGGDGSVRWEEVDDANRHAINAMGVTRVAELITRAVEVNTAKRAK